MVDRTERAFVALPRARRERHEADPLARFLKRIARWDGTCWSALGDGLDDSVNAMTVFDDGRGSGLFVGGWFTMAGAMESRRVIRWSGTSWSAFAAGIADDASDPCWCDPAQCEIACGPRPGFVNALAAFHGALYAGGSFIGADGGCVPNRNIARWGPVPPGRVVFDYDWDGDVDLMDFGHFQQCFNGPNRPFAQPCCDETDTDADGDTDLIDFGAFQQCFNGPNRPPKCPA